MTRLRAPLRLRPTRSPGSALYTASALGWLEQALDPAISATRRGLYLRRAAQCWKLAGRRAPSLAQFAVDPRAGHTPRRVLLARRPDQ